MACDHLDKKTFNNAMEAILTNYNSIYNTFQTSLTNAMNEYYDAWQSVKGFSEINALFKRTAESLDNASEVIVKDYNTMKEGGTAYAKDQNMFLIIEPITKKSFSMENKEFAEDREIIIDDDKIQTAGSNLKKSYERIASCITSCKEQTASDEKFGYYSEGGTNPRYQMYKAFDYLEIALNAATDRWSANFDQLLQSDKQLREQQKHASSVDSSDMSSLFG